jgi:2-polyprenyl-3-methyl-5-hydroxy-6-metoxy-1,4-benzoquinol methylase
MASMNQKGFTILAPLELGGFKRLTIDAKVPLEKWELCPAHGIKLTPFSALVGKGGTPIIRIGYCPVCFYTAYVDRPTAARIRNFYAGDWDSAKTGHRKVLNEATTDSADLLKEIEVISEGSFFDAGCGYGEHLRSAKALGWKHLFGIEPSHDRAVGAATIEGTSIVEGSLEEAETLKKIGGRSYDVILCHHVLEHVSDPLRFVTQLAALQKPGGKLILSVPNFVTEVSMLIHLFMPHFHSFTRRSLVDLLARAGYVVDRESNKTPFNLTVRATRIPTDVKEVPGASRDEVTEEKFFSKFEKGLALTSPVTGTKRLWWYRKADVAGQTFLFGSAALDKAYEKLFTIISRKASWRGLPKSVLGYGVQSLSVAQLNTFYTDLPFELQFEGDMFLLYK